VIRFEYIPKLQHDDPGYREVEVRFNDFDGDETLTEMLDAFKSFLLALTYDTSLLDRIVILTKEELDELRKNE
jgi:hypothetical protein